MKWVRCTVNEVESGYKYITIGKIYEVVEVNMGIIKLINDANEVIGVFLMDFEDVTAEVIASNRDNKINQILK